MKTVKALWRNEMLKCSDYFLVKVYEEWDERSKKEAYLCQRFL